jgi:hypothetical protein
MWVMLAGSIWAAGAVGAGEPASQGPALLAPFKVELQQALKAGMAEGPVQAVTACQAKAPSIAAAHSQGAVRMGRTSDRLRNPANASPEWVEPILAAYLADAPDLAPRSVEIAPGRMGYVEPILLQPMCETCHGTRIAADVAERITALYPEDAATGFEVGDVRGVFYVEYPVGQAETP